MLLLLLLLRTGIAATTVTITIVIVVVFVAVAIPFNRNFFLSFYLPATTVVNSNMEYVFMYEFRECTTVYEITTPPILMTTFFVCLLWLGRSTQAWISYGIDAVSLNVVCHLKICFVVVGICEWEKKRWTKQRISQTFLNVKETRRVGMVWSEVNKRGSLVSKQRHNSIGMGEKFPDKFVCAYRYI